MTSPRREFGKIIGLLAVVFSKTNLGVACAYRFSSHKQKSRLVHDLDLSPTVPKRQKRNRKRNFHGFDSSLCRSNGHRQKRDPATITQGSHQPASFMRSYETRSTRNRSITRVILAKMSFAEILDLTRLVHSLYSFHYRCWHQNSGGAGGRPLPRAEATTRALSKLARGRQAYRRRRVVLARSHS